MSPHLLYGQLSRLPVQWRVRSGANGRATTIPLDLTGPTGVAPTGNAK